MELNRLIKKISHLDITLVAGKKGLSTPVKWIHFVEAPESCSFLDGGEIVIITGIGLNENTTISDLIISVIKANAAGAIVNIGPYIENIPEDVIAYCDEKDFPLFTIPWRIHLAELTRIFSQAIMKDEQNSIHIATAFKNAIAFPGQCEFYQVTLHSHGFKTNAQYCACCIMVSDIKGDTEQRLGTLAYEIDHFLKRTYKNYSVFVYDEQIVIIVSNYTVSEIHDFVNEAVIKTKTLLTKDETITYGCGKITQSIRCLYKTYNQARSIQQLQFSGKLGDQYHFYSSLGVFKLLMAINDTDVIEDYLKNTINPLREYDQAKCTDLCEVLACYLENDCSVQKTSDMLFLHRNTVNYKIAKASEIIERDMSVLHNRVEISLAFMLESYTHSK